MNIRKLKIILSALTVQIISLVISSCGATIKAYKVTGYISGLPDESEVFLTLVSHLNTDTIATAKIANGNFILKGRVDGPRLVNLRVKGSYGSITFMLENSDIHLSAKAMPEKQEYGKVNYKFEDVKVVGSQTDIEFHRLNALRENLDAQYKTHNGKYANLIRKISEARAAGDKAALEQLQNSKEAIAMAEEEAALSSQFQPIFDKTLETNKNTFWGPLLMIAQTSYLTTDQRAAYEKLSPKVKNSYYGREVYQELYPAGKPGDKMKGFTATTIKGERTSLAEVCKDKKYVLIDFWASWCRPCRVEISNLKKIYTELAPKGFDIISVSIDKDEALWHKAIETEGMPWTNVRDTDHRIAEAYNISSVPTMYIVDSEGRLASEVFQGEELIAKIRELFTK